PLDVQNLAPQRQDRLEAPVAPLLRGAAGGSALDQEELRDLRVPLRAVGELARERRAVESALAPGQVPGLARGLARVRGLDALVDDSPSLPRVLLEVGRELVVDDLLDPPLDVRRDQLVLGLRGELRIFDLDRDDRGQPLANVLAGQVLLERLQEPGLRCPGVDRARQRALESDQVSAAIAVVDRVGEAVEQLLITLVPLERDLDDLLAGTVVPLLDQMDRRRVERRLVAVQMLDERADAAGVREVGFLARALVGQMDEDSAVQKRQLAESLGERLVVELEDREDRRIRPEADLGPALLRRADRADRRFGEASVVGLKPDGAVA